MDKPLVFVGSTLARLRTFPEDARRRLGFELRAVQRGHSPSDWKPMRSVGVGVREIRAHAGGEFRVIYLAVFEEAVYALHAFEKKTHRTRLADLAQARTNLSTVLRQRGT